MLHKNIIIVTKQKLTESKEVIADALKHEANAKDKKQFPLVYKYIESKNPENQSEPEETIGTISNLFMDENGDIRGTVSINEVMKSSENFIGVVDNFSVKIIKPISTGKKKTILTPILSHGIIYNKFVKQTIDAKKKTSVNQHIHREVDSPDATYVTNVSDDNPLQNPKVMEKLHDLMEKELGKEAE